MAVSWGGSQGQRFSDQPPANIRDRNVPRNVANQTYTKAPTGNSNKPRNVNAKPQNAKGPRGNVGAPVTNYGNGQRGAMSSGPRVGADGRVLTRKQEQKRQKEEMEARQRRQEQRWLNNDPTFTRQRDMLIESRKNYLADYRNQRGRANEDFNIAAQRLAEARTEGRRTQDESFGGRGMLFSGAYDQDVKDLTNRFSQQKADLTMERERILADLDTNRETYLRGIRNERLNAREEALRRRVQQLGIRN